MRKATKTMILPWIMACLLASCNQVEPTTSNSTYTTDTSNSIVQQYTVSFYDGDDLYQVQTVDEGECAIEPEKPTKVEKEFQYWCSDPALTTRYSFTTPVTSDLSLYSLYENLPPFEDYNDKFLPVHAPFLTEQHFFEDDKDIEIALVPDGVTMSSSINTDQVLLSGGFEDLEVKSVKVETNLITIQTAGSVKNEMSYVTFSKATNKNNNYLTMPFEINERFIPSVSVDKSSILFDKKDILFSVRSEYQTLKHSAEMTPEQYLENIQNETFNYFSVTKEQNVSLSILSIHNDFTGFDAKLHYEGDGDFNEEILENISQNVKLSITKDAFEDEKEHEFSFDLNVPQSTSRILVTPVKVNTYTGNYLIHLNGCKFRSDLPSHIEQMTTSPNNKNLLISVPDAEVTIESLRIINDFEIQGKLKIETEAQIKDAAVSLNEVTIGENVIKFLTKQFKDEDVSVSQEILPIEIGYDSSLTGTIHQDDGANYKGVKSYIQDIALDDADNTIDQLISIGCTLGKIAYGAYSGNYTMVKETVGKALGIDSLRDPSSLMLDRLQSVMDKLVEIDNRIQALGEKLDGLKKELETIGKETYLNSFLNAYDMWNSFKSDYYAPMLDQIRNYTTAYYRYYYDFAMASHPDSSGKTASIDIYYDETGEVVFPAGNLIYSVDGKIIDKSKTKTIVFPELEHTLAGIRHEDGHAYRSIENDIIADLVRHSTYSDKEIGDILKTLTFNAMKSYFSSQIVIDGFTNKFENFCQALTASDIISSINISPLECFTIILQTIFNFGFEIEPDLNLVTIKLQTIFYSARKIFDFVCVINSGDVSIESYDTLLRDVETELSSDRFYHSNDENGNVFCFVSNIYVTAATNAYAIQFGRDWYDKKTVRLVENDYKNFSAPQLESFESISEEDIAFMKIKVKIYNIVKGTNYSFKSYLGKIGIIPKEVYDKTLGILTRIDGIVEGDDTYDLKAPHLLDQVYFHEVGNEPSYVSERKYDMKEWDRVLAEYVYAIKGRMISFDDDETYDMIAGFGSTHMREATGEFHDQPIAFFGSDVDIAFFWDDFSDSVTVWSYYVVFKPVH